MLSEGERRSIARYHDELLADHDIDYRVVTTRTGGDVDQAGHQAFAELGVGERSGSSRGLLLLIDPSADRVRLEVASGLEGVFTDAFVAYLEQRQMVPFFRSGRVADGILATTELIVARAQQAAAGAAFDPATVASFSLGGGASTAARIGAGPERSREQDGSQVAPQATPEATVSAYLAAMAGRNGRPDLAVYSSESRRMLGSWTMTPAQMDSVVRTYRGCRRGEVRYGPGAELAVLRYQPAARQCAPWFLRREDAGSGDNATPHPLQPPQRMAHVRSGGPRLRLCLRRLALRPQRLSDRAALGSAGEHRQLEAVLAGAGDGVLVAGVGVTHDP